MNSIEFIKAVDLVAKEKCISKDIIFEAMELALASAYKKNFDSKQSRWISGSGQGVRNN